MNLAGTLHFIGALLSIAAISLMATFAALKGDAYHVVSASIFGTSLFALYIISAIYHFMSQGHRLKPIFQRLDQGIVYLFFAGTYTPIMLTLQDKAWGWSLFGVAWGLGLAGFTLSLKAKAPKLIWWFFYFLLGSFVVVTFYPLYIFLSSESLRWMGIADMAYRLAALFYFLDERVPHKAPKYISWHDIHHLCLLAGSFGYFWLVLKTLY